MLSSQEREEVKDTLESIRNEEIRYKAGNWRKWVVMAAGLLVGLVLGTTLPKLINKVTHSQYNRKGLDAIMKDLLGDHHIKDVLSDEVLIVAYDYNSQEPRFYSKLSSALDPKIYDVPVGEATGASSAAPTFFDPKMRTDGYGFTEL